MRLPLSSVALIVTIFAKNVVNTSLANSSNSQSTSTGLCNKPPVNNCNCQCRLAQNSQLSNAVKALEKKLENLTQNSQLGNAVKALEKKLENLTQNSQLSDAMKGLEKKLENLIALVNKSSFDVPKPFPPADAIISSCKEQYERDNSSRSQVYNLTTGNQQIPVYCHMGKFGNFGCGDGGWTMVMKMDSVKRTFHYNSILWSNMNAYNPAGGQSGFDKQETKLPTYWHTPFSTICLGMRIGTQLNLAVINRQATSLSSLIADGSYRATSLNRTSWKSLIGSAGSLQTRCNRQGFNVESEIASYAKVRIGIIANNENNCKTSDSRIGFGGGGVPDDSNTCGNAARLKTDNGDKFIHAMGYILVQ